MKTYRDANNERRKKAARAIEGAYYGGTADELTDEKISDTNWEDDKA